jgi:GT2 family glycosyltransferase
LKQEAVKISVIIPNLHSPIMDQTLKSVLSQECDHAFEVIVVGMDKYDLVKQFKEVNFIETPSPVGAAEARNLGIQHACGDWLLFIDSDCIAEPGWMAAFIEAFENGWQVVGGGVKTPQEPFWLLVYNLSMFHSTLATQKTKETKFLPTLNLAVQRLVIDKVGMMDESLLRGQDVDWTARMTLSGYKLLFEPSAVVEHLPARTDLATLRAYNYKGGYYMIRVRHTYPEIFTMPSIMKKPYFFKLFGPVVAAMTTLKIILKTKEVRQHLKIVPYIYLQKLSWCRGAVDSLEDLKNHDG